MHPLAPNLSDLTDEELHKKHGEVQTKLLMAYRMGNGQLCGQLQLLLDDYAQEVGRRNQKMFDDANKSGRNLADKIDITK